MLQRQQPVSCQKSAADGKDPPFWDGFFFMGEEQCRVQRKDDDGVQPHVDL